MQEPIPALILVLRRTARPAQTALVPAETLPAAINVAGTEALGDYLASRIANVRTLMGLGASGSGAPAPGSAVVKTAIFYFVAGPLLAICLLTREMCRSRRAARNGPLRLSKL